MKWWIWEGLYGCPARRPHVFLSSGIWWYVGCVVEKGPVEDKGHGCVINDAVLQCIFISIIFLYFHCCRCSTYAMLKYVTLRWCKVWKIALQICAWLPGPGWNHPRYHHVAGLKERDQMVVSLRLGCPKLTGSPEFPQVWTILGFPFEDIRLTFLKTSLPSLDWDWASLPEFAVWSDGI